MLLARSRSTVLLDPPDPAAGPRGESTTRVLSLRCLAAHGRCTFAGDPNRNPALVARRMTEAAQLPERRPGARDGLRNLRCLKSVRHNARAPPNPANTVFSGPAAEPLADRSRQRAAFRRTAARARWRTPRP